MLIPLPVDMPMLHGWRTQKEQLASNLVTFQNNLLCATSLMVARKGDKVIVREYLLERHCFSKLVYLPCLDQVLDHNSCFAIRIVA